MLFLRSLAFGFLAASALAQEVPKQLQSLDKRTLDWPAAVNVAYSDLHYTTLDSYNTLVSACSSASLGQVQLAFLKIQSAVLTLALKNRLACTYTPGIAFRYVDNFFQALREVQILLRFVNNYPKLVLGCRPIFNSMTTYFNWIITDMRANGVEFSHPTRAYGKFIDYNFFQFIGITLSLGF